MPAARHYSSPLRWGIIGCGDVTEVKSGPAYRLTEGFTLAAVMRRDVDKLRDYARRHGVAKYYTDAQALIDDPAVDAVYIATPPDSHHRYGLAVAAAGKPCCIEKPLAPSYAESREICAAFERRGVPLFVAYYRRSLPRFERVREWLAAGAIGEVRHVSCHLSKPPSTLDLSGAANWRTDAAVAPGGYFDDLASHSLDLLTYYLGDIQTVHGVSRNQQGRYTALDAVSACWLHTGGVTGVGNWNFGSATAEDRVVLYGSTGQIRFSVFADAPLLLERAGEREEVAIAHPAHVQEGHVENMRRALFEPDFRHPSTGASALHTSWVMDRILGRIPPSEAAPTPTTTSP